MNAKISEIAARMAELEGRLERALADEVEEQRRKFFYVIEKGKVVLEPGAHARYQKLLDFGDAGAYGKELAALRADVRP